MNVGVDASKVVITKLKIDKDRKSLLEKMLCKTSISLSVSYSILWF